MALLQISEPGKSTMPHEHRLAVGIDLGTTNSLIASVVSVEVSILEQGNEEHLESISEQKSELEKFQLLIDGEYQENLNSLESVCDKDKNWDIAIEMLNEIQFIDKLNSRIIQQINLVETK